MFRVGQKVVCIDNSNGAPTAKYGYASDDLKKGEIYTIKSMVADGADVFLRLHEVGGGWLKERFRPVVEQKTDISVFTAMLNTKKSKINA